jgi:UDP-GlcNAc:undecaprenyl-phosphate GlcNAc-1-phosphate transferase
MLIGLAVGVMAIQASLKGTGTVLLAVPLALWTIPIFDTGAAVVRRKLTGRSIYTTDRAHLHHRLLDRFGHRMTLVFVAAVSLLTSLAALLSVWWKHDVIALACAGLVVLVFVSLRVFGHSELMLAVVRVRSLVRSILLPQPQHASQGWDDSVRLQGNTQWDVLWETFTDCALKLELVQLRLDVNVPILGEGYYATWSRPRHLEHNRYWQLDLPLMVDERTLGHVNVVGERGGIAIDNLEPVLDLVDQMEKHLVELLHAEATGPRPSMPVRLAGPAAPAAVLERT